MPPYMAALPAPLQALQAFANYFYTPVARPGVIIPPYTYDAASCLKNNGFTATCAEMIASEIIAAMTNAPDTVTISNQLSFLSSNHSGSKTTWSTWLSKIAEWILKKLELLLKETSKLGPRNKAAYEKAYEAAEEVQKLACKVAEGTKEYCKEHPVFCTLVALGVLAQIAPWVLEWLGFSALGPVKGSWAAWWQSTYGGYVPKESLFAFFQRLGMIWTI